MGKKDSLVPVESLDRLIYEIRGLRVMLDSDLAALYGVETKALKRSVNRNRVRFPSDFMFQLTAEEYDSLRRQIGTLKRGQHAKYLPYVFTEHGAIMTATILNTPRAVQMSVFVVRAFLKMRAVLSNSRELTRKLAALEKDLKERLDVHEAAIVTILQRVMDIIDPPAQPEPPQKHIGYHVKDGKGRYRVRAIG
jgi:phage regulator Rha-like protein